MQIFFGIQTEFQWSTDSNNNCTFDYREQHCLNASLALLDEIKYSSVSYVVFGISAILMSLPVLLTVCFTSSLRNNKSYVLIANLAFWDLLMSASFVYKGSKRLYLSLLRQPETIDQYRCLLEETALITSLGGNIVVFLLTALDRFSAIIFPKWYQLKYPRWLQLVMYTLAYGYLFFEIACLYVKSDSNHYVPICSYPTASHVTALQRQGYRTKCVVGATILVYGINIFWVIYQLRSAKRKHLNLSITRKRLQVRVLGTLLLILLSFLLTITVAHVLYSVALVQQDFAVSLNLATFCGTFVCINGLANFPILYFRTKQFKNAANRLFACSCIRSFNDRSSRTTSLRRQSEKNLDVFDELKMGEM